MTIILDLYNKIMNILLITLLLCSISMNESVIFPIKHIKPNFHAFNVIQNFIRSHTSTGKAIHDNIIPCIRSKTRNILMIVNNSTEYHKIKSYIRHLKRNNTNEEKLIQSFYQELNTEDRQFFDNIDKDNAEALKLLKTLLSERDQWSYVATNKDVTVARRYLSAGPFVSHLDAEKGDKHACVKSSAVLNASAADIFNLFLDTDLATEYNEHIASVSDLYSPHISSKTTSWTKISYTTGPSLGIFKARDFCSVVNYIISPDKSSYIILNRPAYFSQAKPNSKYTRATIMLAGNIITSLGPDKAEVTLVAHVNPGGAGDTMAAAFFINQLCAMGPPTFIRRLEAAAKNMHHTKPPLSSAKARYVKMK